MKEKKPMNVEIGEHVKAVREACGLTQERFAELLGLGVKHISAIERGAAGVSLPTLWRICTLLSVPADAILFGPQTDASSDQRAAALHMLTDRLARLPEHQFWAVKDILDRLLEVMALDSRP